MQQDDTVVSLSPDADPTREPSRPVGKSRFSIFDIPAPLRALFDRFPLVTYSANELPLRAPRQHRSRHVLHVFTTAEEAAAGAPSFNPGCLKWQTFLRFTGLDFAISPSSNHASPSGALPFLQPSQASTKADSPPLDPIPSKRLRKWLGTQTGIRHMSEPEDVRYESYQSLLDNRVRKAWLLQLYLTPANLPILTRLYVDPCSSQIVVRWQITQQLRAAAESEIIKSADSQAVSATDIIQEAAEAFRALSTLLKNDDWFFGQSQPGLFDASVFAYTNLILDGGLAWASNPLRNELSKNTNLVQHRARILDMYY